MTDERQQLLARILLSRHFSYADALRRILQYLCDHPETRVKEHELAVSALGRPESFDSKTDPVIRVCMTSIRERLAAFFEGEGRGERWVLSIPKGRYQVVYAERDVVDTATVEPSALRRFWAPYLAPNALNVVTYTEPLFFRDASGRYIRDIQINHRDGMPLEACYHYLSSGEIQAAISLVRLFQELGAPLDLRNARLSSLTELSQTNLILLGSVRTNHLIDRLSGPPGWVMTRDTLESEGKGEVFRGSRTMDGKLPRFTDFVLVTRRPGLAPGSTITIIASHHGRACQGVGTFLTIETEVAALLETIGKTPLPEHFQILMRVEMMDLDAEVVEVRYLQHRTF